jgi:hypothetical protein
MYDDSERRLSVVPTMFDHIFNPYNAITVLSEIAVPISFWCLTLPDIAHLSDASGLVGT